MNAPIRVLFFAEPATLAHVIRPIVLARALAQQGHEVSVATGRDYRQFAEQENLEVRDLRSIGTRAYLRAVDAGRVVFPLRTLDAYVRDDLRHLEAYGPHVVVGDFRLSLAVSARLANIPYIALSNAYWSPCAAARYDIPAHPLTRLLGPAVPNALFRLLRPVILAHHSMPMHRLRKRYGLPSLGFDLGAVFTEGDVTAFADLPELVPGADCGDTHRYRYIGPLPWSPAGVLPEAFAKSSDSKPWVYVSMGSSGDPRLVPTLLAALARMNCRVALATAGAIPPDAVPRDVVAAAFMPGAAAAARASLVVCNGGSPSTYQALAQGTPVLGIPANLDQLLNMYFVARSGAGAVLRADRVTEARVADMAEHMLATPSFRAAAERIASSLREYHPADRFATIVRELAP